MYTCDYCKKEIENNKVSFVYPTINEPIDQFKKVKAICEMCLEYSNIKKDKKGFYKD